MIALAIALVGSLGIVALAVLGSKWLDIKRDAVKFNRSKMAAVRAAKKSASGAGTGDHPAWLADLIESLGADASILDDDEVPEIIEQFMPAIQGFIDGGGLAKLKSAKPPAEEFVGY